METRGGCLESQSPSLPANERLPVHIQAGMCISEQGKGRARLGAPCTLWAVFCHIMGTQGERHLISSQGTKVWSKELSRRGNCRETEGPSPEAGPKVHLLLGASVSLLGKPGYSPTSCQQSRQKPTSRNVLFGPHNIFKNIHTHCQHLKIGSASSNSSFLKFICKLGGCGIMSPNPHIATEVGPS